MHEEDAGFQWKHTCARTGHAEVRRGRKLIVSMIATFLNYEYGFYWSLFQVGEKGGRVASEVGCGGVIT
jgi:primary-amine oxidase